MYMHDMMCAQAETAFTNACLADTADLREQLYQEMRGAIQEADQTAPLRCPRALLAWLHVTLWCCQKEGPACGIRTASLMLTHPPA